MKFILYKLYRYTFNENEKKTFNEIFNNKKKQIFPSQCSWLLTSDDNFLKLRSGSESCGSGRVICIRTDPNAILNFGHKFHQLSSTTVYYKYSNNDTFTQCCGTGAGRSRGFLVGAGADFFGSAPAPFFGKWKTR